MGQSLIGKTPAITRWAVLSGIYGAVLVTLPVALDKMLKLKRRKGTDHYLETELVIRKSTAPPRPEPLRGIRPRAPKPERPVPQ